MRTFALPLALASIAFGAMYVNVGVQHFTNTAWFEPIVPEIPGGPTFWVLITGVMEIAIGVGLILPRTRRIAAFGSMAFLVGIYWANLNMWVNDLPFNGTRLSTQGHVIRWCVQIVLLLTLAWMAQFQPFLRAHATEK